MSANNFNQLINISINRRRLYLLKKIGKFSLIICFVLLLFPTFQKSLKNIKLKELNVGNFHEETPRHLDVEFDNFMILYYKEDCNYYQGFKNKFRNNISFIINRENNNNLTNEEELIIHKNFGIEIHFNQKVTNVERFFDANTDSNIEYLISVDLSHFDTSLITYMYAFFIMLFH